MVALLVFLSVLLTFLSACSRPEIENHAAQLNPQEINLRYEKLIGDNGLLFSPDFWGSLNTSYESEIAYRLIHGENVKETWPHTLEETFTHLEESSGAVSAAYMIVEFDLFDDYSPLTDFFPDIHNQWDTVNENDQEAIFTVFALHEIATACDIDLTVTDVHKEIVLNAFSSEFTVEQKWAQELAHAWNMSDTPSLNTTRDFLVAEEISYALWSDYRQGVSYDSVNKELIDQLLHTRLRSDSSTARLYRVLVSYGDTVRAEKVRKSFNNNRLLSDGTVLEMPIFNGTLDSTFRMARYIHETGNLQLDEGVQKEVIETLDKTLYGSSKSDALLAAASLVYLAPEKIRDVDTDKLYQEFLKEAELERLLDGHRLDVNELSVWSRLYQYAIPLGIRLDFPGITEEAEVQLVSSPEETVLLACDVIIALHDLEILEKFPHEKDVALSTIESYVGIYSAHDLATSVVMEIELAYSYVNAPSPFADFNLSDLTSERSGKCVGGYSEFLKELPGDAPCTVEGSRYVYHLKQIEREK